MSVSCIECKHIKTHDKSPSVCFGVCQLNDEVGRYVSIDFERECKQFEADTTERVDGKRKYLEKVKNAKR